MRRCRERNFAGVVWEDEGRVVFRGGWWRSDIASSFHRRADTYHVVGGQDQEKAPVWLGVDAVAVVPMGGKGCGGGRFFSIAA